MDGENSESRNGRKEKVEGEERDQEENLLKIFE